MANKIKFTLKLTKTNDEWMKKKMGNIQQIELLCHLWIYLTYFTKLFSRNNKSINQWPMLVFMHWLIMKRNSFKELKIN